MPERGSEPARYEGWAAIEQAQNLMRSAFSHAMDGQKAKAQRLYDSALDHFRAAVGEAKRRESKLARLEANLDMLDGSTAQALREVAAAEARVAELERVVKAAKAFVATTTRYWNASIDAREAVEEERDRLAEENDELRKNIARLAGALAVHEHGDALRKLADS